MRLVIFGGAVLAVIGLAILIYCIATVVAAKRAGLEDDALKARLQKVLTINMAGLFIAVIGLMTIVVGAMLG